MGWTLGLNYARTLGRISGIQIPHKRTHQVMGDDNSARPDFLQQREVIIIQ